MKASQSRIIPGLILIAAGAVFLLQNLGIVRIGRLGDLVLAALFALGALAFAAVFAGNRAHWWSVIPAGALGGIAGLLALGWLSPRLGSALGGSIFLGTLGLAFWLIFASQRQHWWAIIPGGVLVTLAAVAAADNILRGNLSGVLFFLGLSATFGALTVLPTEKGQMRWALIPAGVCLLLAVIVFLSLSAIAGIVVPLALILLGVYLLLRSQRSGKVTASLQKEQ